jgi:hypothetical protein
MQCLTNKGFQRLRIYLGNDWATKATKTSASTAQRKENILLGVECVCPYHKQKAKISFYTILID